MGDYKEVYGKVPNTLPPYLILTSHTTLAQYQSQEIGTIHRLHSDFTSYRHTGYSEAQNATVGLELE